MRKKGALYRRILSNFVRSEVTPIMIYATDVTTIAVLTSQQSFFCSSAFQNARREPDMKSKYTKLKRTESTKGFSAEYCPILNTRVCPKKRQEEKI